MNIYQVICFHSTFTKDGLLRRKRKLVDRLLLCPEIVRQVFPVAGKINGVESMWSWHWKCVNVFASPWVLFLLHCMANWAITPHNSMVKSLLKRLELVLDLIQAACSAVAFSKPTDPMRCCPPPSVLHLVLERKHPTWHQVWCRRLGSNVQTSCSTHCTLLSTPLTSTISIKRQFITPEVLDLAVWSRQAWGFSSWHAHTFTARTHTPARAHSSACLRNTNPLSNRHTHGATHSAAPAP